MGIATAFPPKPVYIRAAGGVAAAAASLSELAGSAEAQLSVDAEPVALRARVAQVAPQVSRMASRFSQLAVLGAADCLRRFDGVLDPDTRIYLATGLGDVAHTDALYYGVMPPQSEMPPPARFATSGNNMAAFFVAQYAGLTSRNLTLSHADLSLECTLELALSDFAAGATRAALLGSVDETTLPREFYTRRFPVASDQAIGEGSAWLVLDAKPGRGGARSLGTILGARVIAIPVAPDECTWIDRVRQTCEAFAMNEVGTSSLTLLAGTGIRGDEIVSLGSELGARWRTCTSQDYLRWSGRFPTAAALALVSLVARGACETQTCLHVNRDAAGRIGLIAFQVYGRAR